MRNTDIFALFVSVCLMAFTGWQIASLLQTDEVQLIFEKIRASGIVPINAFDAFSGLLIYSILFLLGVYMFLKIFIGKRQG